MNKFILFEIKLKTSEKLNVKFYYICSLVLLIIRNLFHICLIESLYTTGLIIGFIISKIEFISKEIIDGL